MKERPMLFSGPMVRAILEGRKTMTRRVIKPKPGPLAHTSCHGKTTYPVSVLLKDGSTAEPGSPSHLALCPCGQPGDRLWVREAWRVGAWDETEGQIAVDYKSGGYSRKEWLTVDDGGLFQKLWKQSVEDSEKAFGKYDHYSWKPGESPCRWRPSIFMPRWASRILLEVTAVRVERVQDISDKPRDAWNEGATCSCTSPVPQCSGNIEAFRSLWDSINAKRGYGWDANPWVWVISFKRPDAEGGKG